MPQLALSSSLGGRISKDGMEWLGLVEKYSSWQSDPSRSGLMHTGGSLHYPCPGCENIGIARVDQSIAPFSPVSILRYRPVIDASQKGPLGSYGITSRSCFLSFVRGWLMPSRTSNYRTVSAAPFMSARLCVWFFSPLNPSEFYMAWECSSLLKSYNVSMWFKSF